MNTDEVSFVDESTIFGEAHDGEKANNSKDEDVIAKRETRFVRCMELLVLAVLVGAAIGAGLGLYGYTSGAEQTAFEEDFNADASKILASLGKHIDLTLTALDSYASTVVSHAHDRNMTWPFVTIPDNEIRAAKIRTLTKSTYLTHYMLVTREQRADWENFTATHSGWVNQSNFVQANDNNYHGPIIWDYYTADYIHDVEEEPMPERELYNPDWMSSPSIPRWAPYNWDRLSWQPNASVVTQLERKTVQVSETYHPPDPENEEQMEQFNADVDWYSDYVKPGQDPSEPMIDVNYPLLNTIDRVIIKDPWNHTLVGTVTVSIFWRNLLEDILPEGSNGILIVLDNPCTPSCTFQINGPDVVYLGRGDLHDSTYDGYKLNATLLDLDSFSTSTSYYSGIEIDTEYCPHSFRLYPSSTMQAAYITPLPIIMTSVAVLIFVFTALVFIGYDRVVEYRQKMVMKTATKSSAIISSLFPSTVLDRLFNDQQDEIDRKKQKNKAFLASSHTDTDDDLSAFLMKEPNDHQSPNLDTPPIADLFSHTSIFFADLSGFTSWSSSRTPTEVFQLLETIYGAFDRVAKRRSVFKVETIGDCYVACTGLPRPQKGHAVIMVRFARDCLTELHNLKDDLCEKLGEDTRELEMRVGIHSGPTTAGVLRGEKGRFQLFGDTVNTASRMESNGVEGRIHVSQETAEELRAMGKGHWLTPREDKIVAKGKGELQTYFIVVGHSHAASSNGYANTHEGTASMPICSEEPEREAEGTQFSL